MTGDGAGDGAGAGVIAGDLEGAGLALRPKNISYHAIYHLYVRSVIAHFTARAFMVSTGHTEVSMRFTVISLTVFACIFAGATQVSAQSQDSPSGLEPLPLVPLALAPLVEEMEAKYKATSNAVPNVTTSRPILPQSIKAYGDGELRIFDATRNANDDVKAAMQRARRANKNTMIIFGANWCHDSRALSGHFEGQRFATLWDKDYEKVYVEVGQKDRNLDVAARFGLDGIVGTPTVLILDPRGNALNRDSAVHWRNSATLTEDAIFDYFDSFAREARKVR